jgi:nuclear GTP-binding protein
MVKKKGRSKRTTLKDKYKIQRKVAETHRKRKKQAKREAAAGIVRRDKKKKDPGIPNSWPFKQDLLKEIERTRERQQLLQREAKEKRREELRALRQHQERGGTARTVQELMEQAQRDRGAFEAKQDAVQDEEGRSDGTTAVGQQSRRAYLRELKKVVDTADVLLQVLDARDPNGSRIHPAIEDAILSRADKRMVLVLNKIDLVPKEVVGSWLTVLRRSHPTVAVRAGRDRPDAAADDGDASIAATSAASSNLPVGMDGLLQLLKNYARTGGTGGRHKTTITVGCVGYPNVGKSSIINALKRSRAVGVSPRPGFTTSMQEVVLDGNLRLLDSPGVVFDDRSALTGNCIDADSVRDPIPLVQALLRRCDHDSLLMTYNIPTFPAGDVMMFLAMVARSHGRVLKGGIPDKFAAARVVLRDWNQGRIPYYTPPPLTSGPEKEADAVVVSDFGKEFDLSNFDAAAMKSLKDTDEMDFVKLEGDGRAVSKPDRDALQYLATQGGSDDGDEMEEDDSSVEEESSARQRLAAAEDYDFSEM